MLLDLTTNNLTFNKRVKNIVEYFKSSAKKIFKHLIRHNSLLRSIIDEREREDAKEDRNEVTRSDKRKKLCVISYQKLKVTAPSKTPGDYISNKNLALK